ncbi:MAG TPA: hypothetical protein VEV63_06825 [Streptosporangiaceae bacterium]|nr:hypothetical protein [Streptosporangiaceae bacterium]
MAELRVDGDDLVLHLSGTEKAEAVHGDLRAPLSAIRGIDILDDAHGPADRGLKVGMRLPGVAEVATIHSEGRKIFAAVHRDTPRGLRISFEGASYDEWIVGCADPETVASVLPRPGF